MKPSVAVGDVVETGHGSVASAVVNFTLSWHEVQAASVGFVRQLSESSPPEWQTVQCRTPWSCHGNATSD